MSSETAVLLIESLAMIAALTAAFVLYGLALARRESRGTRAPDKITEKRMVGHADPDAHLGRCGSE
jgi:hypothetical protein